MSLFASCVARLFISQGYCALRMETMRSVIGTLITVHPRDANGTKRILFFRGYYAAFPVVRAVTTYTFSIRISTVVWLCQISIIGCPFRPTDGCSRNDVVTNKSASMLLPGENCWTIRLFVRWYRHRNSYFSTRARIFAISTRTRWYRARWCAGMAGICILFLNTIC